MEDAAKLLKVALDQCRGASVSELRFISGMSAAFVDEGGPHFIDLPYLSTERVGEIHELCRSLAEGPVEVSEATTTYTFSLRRIGRLLCKFERRGNVASLILVRDADAEETINAIRPKKRPCTRYKKMKGTTGSRPLPHTLGITYPGRTSWLASR